MWAPKEEEGVYIYASKVYRMKSLIIICASLIPRFSPSLPLHMRTKKPGGREREYKFLMCAVLS